MARSSGPARGRGTFHILYEDIHSHPKTLGLARALSEVCPGLGPDIFADIVVAQLHRLGCWCCRESEDGIVGHLTPRRFAKVMGWAFDGSDQQLWDAWMASGFIDNPGSSDASVHEWEAYAAPLIADRKRKRAARAPLSGDESEPSPKSVRTKSEVCPGQAPDKNRTSRARVRKSETGNRKEEKETRSARPAQSRGAPPIPPAASIEQVSEPETAVAVIDAPSPVVVAERAPGKAPTSEWVDEWNGHLSRRGMPDQIPRPQIGGLLKRLRGLWEQWGSDGQADLQVRQVVGAWFDSDWGGETGFSVNAFLAGGKVNELVAGLTRDHQPARDRRSEERRRLQMEAGLRGLMEAPASYELDDAALAAITSS